MVTKSLIGLASYKSVKDHHRSKKII